MSNKEIADAVAEYELRGIPIEELLAREPSESKLKPLTPSTRAAPMGPVRYAVDPQGEPQASGTKDAPRNS